jgi:trimethylguanosine synthase
MDLKLRTHRFPWHHEYVTVDPKGADDRTKKYVYPGFTSLSSLRRFRRGRLGLNRKIDSLDLALDDEMWYSLTPEAVSKRHARVFRSVCKTAGLILDLFCGLGGDLLFQPKSLFCIGCDILEPRLLQARDLHSAAGSGARIEFVLCDSIKGRSCFREHAFDIVYLSPPWGHEGIMNRNRSPVFGSRRLEQLLVSGRVAFKRALALVGANTNIAFYLPRGMSRDDLLFLAALSNTPLTVDVHEAYDPDDETVSEDHKKFRVRAITAYFGEMANTNIN